MTSAPPNDRYRASLDYLVTYAHEDWVGFSVLTGTAAELLGKGAGPAAEREVVLRIIGDLWDHGARPGDLTSDDDVPFEPWDLDREAALARIGREVAGLDHSPESGEICWLTVP